ncbi:MAG TPA: grasp-with-spasm system ATP-grasp peptide maturase [Myxococcaceae bacterium]|jgi:ATP-GRASP peptide maturase of grasp-with-spasm system
MIWMLSQDTFEISTEEVQDWIEALGHECVRVNGQDLNGDAAFSLHFDGTDSEAELELDGRVLRAGDAEAVWWRRWHRFDNLDAVTEVPDARLRADLRGYLVQEIRAAGDGLFDLLESRPWLTRPDQTEVNKLAMLRAAACAGLAVPPTLVTNDRGRLQEFKDVHGRIITKSIFNGRTFMHEGSSWSLLTAEVGQDDIDRAPARFFPSLVQALTEKELEVRVFYLDGECYSMAIFSQLDAQTALDFRRYNFANPNRFVPYRLPDDVRDAVCRFMASVPLDTGSVDLIRTPQGEHVFLEVNPVGQFQMVSVPCNYNLEKKMAEYLIARAHHG